MELMVTADFGMATDSGSAEHAPAVEPAGDPEAWMRGRIEARRAAQKLLSSMVARGLETREHCERVSRWSRIIARELGLSRERVFDVQLGALLHDVGYLRLDTRKAFGAGSAAFEFAEHPTLGAALLREIPALRRAAPLVASHHERFDGTGFPRGQSGVAIPLEARIFQLVDAYDTLTRQDSNPRSDEEAREWIARGSGTRFDPLVVRAFSAIDRDTWRPIGVLPLVAPR